MGKMLDFVGGGSGGEGNDLCSGPGRKKNDIKR